MGLAITEVGTEDNKAGEHVSVESYSGQVNSDSGGSKVGDGDTGGPGPPDPPDTALDRDNPQGGGLRSSGLENTRWSPTNDRPYTVSISHRYIGSVVAKVYGPMGDEGIYPSPVGIISGKSEGEADTGGPPTDCYVPQDRGQLIPYSFRRNVCRH